MSDEGTRRARAAACEGAGGGEGERAALGAQRLALTLGDAPDSVWEAKPPWCQPWTIVCSGVGVVGGLETLFHAWWLTGAAAAGVCVWWYLFLGEYAQGYEAALAAARRGDARAEQYVLSILTSFGYSGGNENSV